MSGKSDQTKGRVKEGLGALSGDQELQARGKRDRLAGQAKDKAAQAEKQVEKGIDKAKDVAESAFDKAKEALHRK